MTHTKLIPTSALALTLATPLLLAAGAAERPPFADWTAVRHEPRARAFDLRHLAVEVELDIAHATIDGRTTQTFAAIEDGAKGLRLDAVDLAVSSVTDGDGRTLGYRTDGEALWIDLAEPAVAGRPFDVTIAYRATPRSGLFFVRPDAQHPTKPVMIFTQGEMEETRYWLPTWDYPNDRATTETVVTLPASMSVISNGRLIDDRDHGDGTRTVHWRQDRDHVTYLITIVAGEFDVVRETSRSGVALSYHVPKGRAEAIERSFAKTGAIIDFFADWTGVAYPWDKYAQVVVADFMWGGMENTSATTLTDRTLHDARAHLDFPSDGLVAHEAAHQWFGDLVTCRSWEHIWLNEGFATYFEALWAEHDEGADEFGYNLFRKAEGYFEEDEGEYRRPVVTDLYTDPNDLFDSHAYLKGALVLHMLRGLVGEDGFRQGIHTYLERHAGKVAETAELRLALEEATGKPLGWFFAQWLEGQGYPELTVEARHDRATGMLEVRVRQTQDEAQAMAAFRLPLALRVLGAGDGVRDYRIEVTGRDQVIHLPSPEPPLGLTVDPGNRLLAKLRFEPPIEWSAAELERSTAAIDRIRVIHRLGDARSARALELLSGALGNDAFWGVRAEAAKVLGKTRRRDALAPLLGALTDPDSRVRKAVCAGLGELRERDATHRLSQVLSDDASYAARAAAAEALGKLGGPDVFERLRRALDQDSHGDVIRASVLEGMAELGDPAALPIARKWAAYGRPPAVRQKAIRALGKLARRGEHQVEPVRVQLESLASDDPYIWARRAALEALGELADAAALPVVERVAQRELDGRMRRTARIAIRDLRKAAQGETASAVEQLGERVDQLEREVRGRALNAEESK